MVALARAPAPPTQAANHGEVSSDTTLSWGNVPGAAGYRVHWHGTTAPRWQYSRTVGDVDRFLLKDVAIDDWFFGVSSLSKDGYESPAVFPGAAGSFARPLKPPSTP